MGKIEIFHLGTEDGGIGEILNCPTHLAQFNRMIYGDPRQVWPAGPVECPGTVARGWGRWSRRDHWCEGARTVPGWGRQAPTRPARRRSAYSVMIGFLKQGYQIQYTMPEIVRL